MNPLARLHGTAATLLLLAAAPLAAQAWPATQRPEGPPSRLRPEVRIDYIAATTQVLHAGVGMSAPAGTYARVGIAAGAGPAWNGAAGVGARLDGTARFLLDPLGQSRVGVSLGAGLSVRYQESATNAVALVFADVEGARRRGWVPFGQVGLGGGVRVTAGLRRGAATRR